MRVGLSGLLGGRFRQALENIRDTSSDDHFQKYRRFEDYFPLFLENGFEIKAKEIPGRVNELGTLYAFQHLQAAGRLASSPRSFQKTMFAEGRGGD